MILFYSGMNRIMQLIILKIFLQKNYFHKQIIIKNQEYSCVTQVSINN